MNRLLLAAGLLAASLSLGGCVTSGGSAGSEPSCSAQCRSDILAALGSSDLPAPPPVATTSGESAAQALVDWFQAGPGDDLQSVTTDEGAIGDDAGGDDVTALESDCSDLKSDVIKVEADPPAPDAEVRSDLAHAMDAYSTAATECLAGDFDSAGTDDDTGTSWIEKTTARIKEIGGI